MLKETFSLDDIYNKVFKKFFDSIDRVIVINEQGARIENKVDWKKNEGRISLANKFRVLVASPFYMSEGQMLFCGNNQNVNAIMKKSLKQNDHGEGRLYKDILVRVAYSDPELIEEEHLKELIFNSINIWAPKNKTTLSCDQKREQFEKDTIQLLRKEFPLTIQRIEKRFSNEKLCVNTVYKYLGRLIFFSLMYCVNYEIMGERDKKEVKELIRMIEKKLTFPDWEKEFFGDLAENNRLTYLNIDEALYKWDTYRKIAGKIKENDQRLRMDIENHMLLRPETWGFLKVGNEIVGNFNYLFLNEEIEKQMLSGKLLRNNEVGLDPNHLKGKLECSVYIRDIFVDIPYGIDEWKILFKELSKKLISHIRDGIFIKSIYICGSGLYSQKYRENGFVFCAERVDGRKIYKLNIKSELARRSDWIREGKVPFDKTLFNFKKLRGNEQFLDERLKELSLLIYDTDRYIYKSLLVREDAPKVFPVLFAMEDAMFNWSNVFVATMNGEEERIVGVILFKKGPLNWSSDKLKTIAEFMGVSLSKDLEKVEKEYFGKYNNVDDQTISILNCYTNEIFTTIYGYSLEDAMLQAFIKEHSDENMELYVLRETPEEFLVYAKNQFELLETVNGYAEDDRELPCGHMRRVAKK